MGLLYGRAGRLTAENGGFRPGQWAGSKVSAGVVHARAELANGGAAAASACVKFTVIAADGSVQGAKR
jgi:hypothetical protein